MKSVFVLAVAAAMLFSSCSRIPAGDSSQASFVSAIVADDCFICGTGTNDLPTYWGQDNLGVVDLNTFEMLSLGINRYDDTGNLITAGTGAFSVSGSALSGQNVRIKTSSDRGYAFVDFNADAVKIDADAISQHMCQPCLDSFATALNTIDETASIAVVDFVGRKLVPLIESQPWFSIGNYLVDCDFEDTGNVGLYVVYRPVRFHEGNA